MRTLRIARNFVTGLALLGAVISPIACWNRAAPDAAPPLPEVAGFVARSLPIDDHHLFDLGVTDINGDGVLDLFTSNHSARQSFLLGLDSGQFGPNKLFEWGLSQSKQFPGLADSDGSPSFADAGLYVFWRESRLVLRQHGMPGGERVAGIAHFLTPIQIVRRKQARVSTTLQQGADGVERYQVDFSIRPDGELIIEPQPYPRVGAPIAFSIAEGTSLARVFIGCRAVRPATRQFVLRLKDRHGHAWADFNGDSHVDLFAVRGAVRGLAAGIDQETLAYEMFFNLGTRFERRSTLTLGFRKQGCPARQVGLVDVDNDGLLDIYIVCSRCTGNQLYRQHENGAFSNIAGRLGLDISAFGVFAWLDANADGDQDLFWGGDDGFWLFENTAARFVPRKLPGRKRRVQNLTLADYDRDGRGDVFATSDQGNLLFRNTGNGFAEVDPADLGLPQRGLTANWVDYDNDGLVDLHVVPAGLYRQRPDHRFEPIGTLNADIPADRLNSARAAWFDADQDGLRDVVVTVQEPHSAWTSRYSKNDIESDNSWLAVDLIGSPGNRPAVGSLVKVLGRAGNQVQGVGWSEGSHYSCGHYRLYFGLGSQRAVEKLVVRWPDGRQRQMVDVPANQRLTVSRSP